MDAVEFLKTTRRICNSNTHGCTSCVIYQEYNYCHLQCVANPEEIVAAVEKWAAEHPVKTRQSEFLKMFPNAALFSFGTTDICDICPAKVDDTLECDIIRNCGCYGCKRKYWLAEVE